MVNNMRIVWKDSVRGRRRKRYRGHVLEPVENGWKISIPGDDNLYYGYHDAYNAIDKALGGSGRFGPVDRNGGRITIVGKINA